MVLPVIDHHHHAHSSYDKEAKRLLTQRGSVWCWIWTAVGLWAVAAAAGESNGTKAVYRVVLGSPELVLDTVGIVDAVEGVTLEQHTPQKVGCSTLDATTPRPCTPDSVEEPRMTDGNCCSAWAVHRPPGHVAHIFQMEGRWKAVLQSVQWC